MSEIDPYEITEADKKTILDFNRLYHRTPHRTWMKTTWKGVQVAKPPTDIWLYQEIIQECKPDLIIETGTFSGGSAKFFADVMPPEGHVVTVDVTRMGWARAEAKNLKSPITFLHGSSLDPGIVGNIVLLAERAERVMVVLDSLHTKDHVFQEMEVYGPMVTPGQYMVVEDTFTLGEPAEAIESYLPNHPEFEVDEGCDKFFLSFSPGGFLKRVK